MTKGTKTTTLVPSFIAPHGGYENLLSYRKALIVYDGTVRFCDRFIRPSDRTRDQMIQATRSGQAEHSGRQQRIWHFQGNRLKLTNVARASPQELLEDYRDFLRLRVTRAFVNTICMRFHF